MTNSLGIVFPGQGSQSVGMLKDIAEQYHEVKETFHDASNALGYDVWQLTLHGPAEELDKAGERDFAWEELVKSVARTT